MMKKRVMVIVVSLIIFIGAGIAAALYVIGDKIMGEGMTNNLSNISEKGNDTKDSKANSDKNKDVIKDEVLDKVTSDDIKNVNNNIPKTEKIKIASKVLSKLEIKEVIELKDISKGGLSEDEKKRVKEIVGDKFTKEEINEFKDVYMKYKN